MRKLVQSNRNVWRIVVLCILVFITFSYAMFQGGFVSWFLFYSFTPIAMYGFLIAFYPLKKIKAERQLLKTEYNAGEDVKIKINLNRHTVFPLSYLVIEDCFIGPLSNRKVKMMIFPRFRRQFTFTYEIADVPRGEHFIQEVLIKTGDLFGLIEKEHLLILENRIVVYPRYEEINYRTMTNFYDQGLIVSRDRVQKDTTVAIGIREYQPGDRLSWINWKVTAKRNEIMTKEFEQLQSQDVYIYMDCGQEKRFEIIVSFTASLIRGILHKGGQVGLITVSSERSEIMAHGGKDQQKRLFLHLAKVKDLCLISFSEVLEKEYMLNEQMTSLLLVTSQLTKSLIIQAAVVASGRKGVTIFCMKKENERVDEHEHTLKTFGANQGINVIFVHQNHFADVFSGVSRG